MKCEVIHPGWNEYHFDLADKYVAYGMKHQMFIVGHTLIWHSQLSPFVKNIKEQRLPSAFHDQSHQYRSRPVCR